MGRFYFDKPNLMLFADLMFNLKFQFNLSWSVTRAFVMVSRLSNVAIFITNVDSENHTFINHKCVWGALKRHFYQTRAITIASLSAVICHSICYFSFNCLLSCAGAFLKISFELALQALWQSISSGSFGNVIQNGMVKFECF